MNTNCFSNFFKIPWQNWTRKERIEAPIYYYRIMENKNLKEKIFFTRHELARGDKNNHQKM
jgi:hypothetical protein